MKKSICFVILLELLLAVFTACDSPSSLHFHAWGDWVTIQEATCTNNGLSERTCACGEKEQEIIYATGSEGLTYELNDDRTGYVVTSSYACEDQVVYIPSVYQGLPVTEVDWFAFSCCYTITEVIIPESVTSINYSAFSYCRDITEITLPKSVTFIGDFAFYNCTGLTSITIPAGVTSIGERAFLECPNLSHITFEGTAEQWNAISKGTRWNGAAPATEVICSDGTVPLN